MVFGVKAVKSEDKWVVEDFAQEMYDKSKEMTLMPWVYNYAFAKDMVVFNYEPLAPPIYRLGMIFLLVNYFFGWTVFLFLAIIFFLFKLFWLDKFYYYMILLGLKKKGHNVSLQYVKEGDVARAGWFKDGAN